MNVLFIGATGAVGSEVVPFLKEKFSLTAAAFHEGKVAGLPVVAVDICNWEQIEALIAKGAANGEPFDAIVYCATANYHGTRQWDEEERRRYFENCIEVNARGAYHVYEAAWRANVPRVIHIGSMTSVLGQPHYDYLDAEARDRPNDLYAATKIFGEHVGRSYVYRPRWKRSQYDGDKASMQVICLRLGQPVPSLEWWRRSGHKDSRVLVWMEDIARAIERALLTDVEYGVYPIVSAVEQTWVDPELYAELGYEPAWKFSVINDSITRISEIEQQSQEKQSLAGSQLPAEQKSTSGVLQDLAKG